MEVRPITLRTANAFILNFHRHHGGTVGCKFALGLFDGDKMVGCAVCGRPVARGLDNGLTCEVNRLCTNGTKNACSMLYGACCRVAKAMGYKTIYTYTLETESGVSLKAAGFSLDKVTAGGSWDCPTRNRKDKHPTEKKKRWVKKF